MNMPNKSDIKFRGRITTMGIIPGTEKAEKPRVEFVVATKLAGGRGTHPCPLPEGFDVWASTEGEIQRWIENGLLPMNHPALAQWTSAQYILRDRVKIEVNGPALLKAVSIIALNGLVMPDWMAASYVARFLKVERLEVGSLDEAFGPLPFKRGKQLSALRQRRQLIPKISQMLIAAMNADPSKPITKDLYAEIGEQLGKSATFVEDAYREGVKKHGMQDIKRLKDLKLFPYR